MAAEKGKWARLARLIGVPRISTSPTCAAQERPVACVERLLSKDEPK